MSINIPSSSNLLQGIEYIQMSRLNNYFKLGYRCFKIDVEAECLSCKYLKLSKEDANQIVEAYILENM